MASLRRTCSYGRRARTDGRPTGLALTAIAFALLASACGHAGEGGGTVPVAKTVTNTDDSTDTGGSLGASTAPSAGTGAGAAVQMPSGQQARCVPAAEGRLKARISGEIDAEIDWSPPTPQCLGGLRPDGDGVRLIYKGDVPGQGPLLVIIGIGPLSAGESARNVPANLTVVREGAGHFYATQGDDKCAMDEVRQEQLGEDGHTFRLTGRGYCTQPARAVGGDGVVLVPRFDVTAVVVYK
jgi:hypothetical protein